MSIDNETHWSQQPFSKASLVLNAAEEVKRICERMNQIVFHELHRKGGVLGISGGIDSSVVLAMCARAFGPDKVVGLLLPEKESSPESTRLALMVAEKYGVQPVIEDITGPLEGFGCYRRRDEAIRRVFPDYGEGWVSKIVLPGNLLEKGGLNVFQLIVTSPEGKEYSKRLPPAEFLQIMAASNFKQRSRMAMLYYHAELRNFAVIGTTNKNEHDLGFFVKYGDGGVDVDPVGHLFKTQIYQLAQYLEIPEEIQKRTPTTDTYPGGSSQEEFFYRIPFAVLDTIWYGYEQGVPNEEIAAALDLTVEQVARVIADIISKQRTTKYLRASVVDV